MIWSQSCRPQWWPNRLDWACTIFVTISLSIAAGASAQSKPRQKAGAAVEPADVTAARRYLSLNLTSAQAHLRLADALATHEIFGSKEAYQHYAAALQLDPTNYHAAYSGGFNAMMVSETAAAIDLLGAATRIAPDSAEAFRWLAMTLEDRPSALDTWTTFIALEQRPIDRAQGKLAKCELLIALGRPKEALVLVQGVVDTLSRYADGWWMLGLVYSSLGAPQLALIPYARAIEYTSEVPNFSLRGVFDSAANAFTVTHKADEFRSLLDAALRDDTANTWLRQQYASYLESQKAYEAALSHRRILASQSAYLSQYDLGGTLFELGRYEEAIRAYRAELQRDSTLYGAWFNIGAASARLNREDDAFQAYLNAARVGPQQAEVWTRLGITAGVAGLEREAVAFFERGLRVDPAIFDSLPGARAIWERHLKSVGEQPPVTDAEVLRLSKRSTSARNPTGVNAQATAPAQSPPAGAKKPPVTTPTQRTARASGSGVVLGDGTAIISNAHVTEGCGELRISGALRKSVVASIVSVDKANDLVLLSTSAAVGTGLPLRSGPVLLGEEVVVLGYPLQGLLAAQVNVTTGDISALAGIRNDGRVYQLTAPVQAGSSGGPVIDRSGNVVAVVVSKLDAGRVYKAMGELPQNVNFAIKGSIVSAFLEGQGLAFQARAAGAPLPATGVAEVGRKGTVFIECF